MRIATWNLERVPKNKTTQIQAKLKSLDADLLILTETSSAIILKGYQSLSSMPLPENFDGINYKAGENRVTIFTKFNISKVFPTFNPYTSVCCEVKTQLGILTVYGSIIGIFGNRQPRFNDDLEGQITDFEKIFPGKNVCFGGDLNTTFSGRFSQVTLQDKS